MKIFIRTSPKFYSANGTYFFVLNTCCCELQIFDRISKGELKSVKLIVKADVQGSVEALNQSLVKLANDEVSIDIIHSAVGAVKESDVTLAETAGAIIIAFNVTADPKAKLLAEQKKVEIFAVEQINRKFLDGKYLQEDGTGANYVLIGPGRWGSSDYWLGIPVKWPHISAARVIVEAGLKNYVFSGFYNIV